MNRSLIARNALMLAGGLALAASIFVSIRDNLNEPWTAVRLAPSFALVRGEHLYSTPEKPPWTMVGYGPLYPVAYLPCAIATEPALAVTIGTLLAHLYVLVPLTLLATVFCKRLGQRSMEGGLAITWLPLTLFLAMLTSVAPSLHATTSWVHVDAPATGLFLLACWATLTHGDAARSRGSVAAGVLAGLALCCKINLLLSVAALAVFALWTKGWRQTALYLLCVAVTTGVVYGWAMLRDGIGPVIYNVGVTGRFPWCTAHQIGSYTLDGASYAFGDKIRTAFQLGYEYIRAYGVVALLAVAALGVAGPRQWRASRGSAGEMAVFFLLVAVMALPASIASVAKYGGSLNSYSLFTLPLALSVVFGVAMAAHNGRRGFVLAASVGFIGAVSIVAISAAAIRLPRAIAQKTSALEEAYATVKARPGECYFPFDPLAHILGEGCSRPNMDCVYSYAVARRPVDRIAFAAAMPERLRYVAVPRVIAFWGMPEIRRLLPEFDAASSALGLRRHDVWSKHEDSAQK
jgi:hypothetical protein